jgi:hypothetical protein
MYVGRNIVACSVNTFAAERQQYPRTFPFVLVLQVTVNNKRITVFRVVVEVEELVPFAPLKSNKMFRTALET